VEGRPLAEAELVEQAKRGDAAAYGSLVRQHQEVAFRTAYVITRSAADAEEVAQEAFLKAYRALGRFRAGSPFRPWLLSIVANEARNKRRSAGRREGLTLRLAASAASGDAAPSPEAGVEAADERERVLAALARLREEDRLVIAYRFFLELSEEEAAAALGVRAGTAKSRLWRALQRLRAELGDGDG
jgi:RNA polymerase sigma-70 factor (ECF subfamily)